MSPFVIAVLVSLGIGYFCGNFLSGFLLGKRAHVDLRKEGSGNIGTTNALRILGPRAALITLILDVLKSIIAVAVIHLIYGGNPLYAKELVHVLALLAAFGAVMGHDYPIYMRFQGGKGAATSLGLILACFPQTFPLIAIVFFAVVIKTRFVSLGSMLAAFIFFVQVLVLGSTGHLMFYQNQLSWAYLVSGLVLLFILIRHRSNIKRLLAGEENPISLHKKE